MVAIHRLHRLREKVPHFKKICLVFLAALTIGLAYVAIAAPDGELTLTPNFGATSGGNEVVITRTPNISGQEINYTFTGNQQTFTAPVTGEYQLEVWGAQGGKNTTAGRGGYTKGTVNLTAGQTVYINVGGQGANVGVGGYNGGGSNTIGTDGGAGGGGATHVALSSGTLNTFGSNRTQLLAVAGGGGGSTSLNTNCGGNGGGSAGTRATCTGNNGYGGTTAAGAAGGNGGGAGSFGLGGSTSSKAGGSNYGGGGGGGFFGGGSGDAGRGGGGGGGSGYFSTSLTDASTVAGDTIFTDPDGSTVTGHAGHGHARITILEEGFFFAPVVYFDGIQATVTDFTIDSVTVIAPAHDYGTVDVWIEGDEEVVGSYYYWKPAETYINECTTDGGTTWDTLQYINASSPVTCRIVLDDSYDGIIELGDDYYSTINSGLAGSFASSDSRFNSTTNTFTLTRGDTLDSAGQTLYYTYTSPSWATIDQYWESDGSNQDDLFWPGLEVSATPNNPAHAISRNSDAVFFGIMAEAYTISPVNPSSEYCEGCTETFTVSTHGAPYNGTVTLSEDLSNSDNPGGTPGTFNMNQLDFSGWDGSDLQFEYTPMTSATSPNQIKVCGASANPAITDDCLDLQVATRIVILTGPTHLARGETGEYTLTIDSTGISVNFAGKVAITELTNNLLPGGGVFEDTSSGTNPTGTFDAATKTYTFEINGTETYERTFKYTMPDVDATSMRLTATADSGEYTFANITMIADQIIFKCGASYPDCRYGYVGELKDYIIRPNGTFTGSATLGTSDSGTLSIGNSVSWNNASTPITTSYIPSATGRQTLSAVAASTVNTGMDGESYFSSGADSINDYIWVMANQMSIIGDDEITNAGSGYFTVSLNGPFIGDISLSDTVSGVSQGGIFSNGGICSFTLADYDAASNKTSCTFMYTPTVVANNRTITITPSVAPDYSHAMAGASTTTYVYGYPRIDALSPLTGPSTGETVVFFTGVNLSAVSYVTFDGLLCANLNIITDTAMSCFAPAHAAGTVDVIANGNTNNILNYTYFNLATDYINECTLDGGATWTTEPYVDPGTTVDCRIVLNGRHQGVVSVSDDLYSTIDPGLSGVFASSDQRFVAEGIGGYFDVGLPDTADSAGRTLEYTYTSPTWEVLEGYYVDDGSTDDDLYWPLIETSVAASDSTIMASSGDPVVFGLYAQEYFISLDGDYPFFCVDCDIDYKVSTHGAPYEGTITLADDLSNSDDPSGESGIFSADGAAGNPVMDFSGSDGTASGFTYTPKTSAAAAGKLVQVCGTSAGPSIADNCVDIAPIINSGISIKPIGASSMLLRGHTGTYTLTVTISPDWSGTINLVDVFSAGGPGDGVFADVSLAPDPLGTFDPAANTYTFTAGAAETYTRTFSYTLRDDDIVGPEFPSYTLQLIGESSGPVNQAYTNVYIEADEINIKCAASYPNCTTGYVGVLKDYSFSPNGTMVGSATVSASDAGELGEVAWTTAAPYTISYTPTTPGRQILTATVNDSTNSAMNGQSYYSTESNSLDDYIWVMANEVAITGPSVLRSGASGTFTATFNGPFIGTVNLADLIDANAANGSFSNGGTCIVDLDDYNVTSNTTSCTFTYSPDIFDDSTSVTLAPSVSEDYPYIVAPTAWSVLVYGKPIITNIAPENGPTTGGNTVTISGENLAQMGGLSVGNIQISLSEITIVDDHTVSFIAPPNSAGIADVAVLVSNRTFHHPDLYTYIPVIQDIDPNLGPTTGGTGFGTEYNADGTVTITGDGILPTTRYSDGITQYSKMDYLEFDGSQYINTGVDQLGNTKMTIDMTRDSGMYVAGVLVPSEYFMITLNDNGLMPPTANYGNASRTSGGIMAPGSRINATLDANGSTASFAVSLNGGSTNTNTISPSSPPSNAYNIYLGRINNGAGTTDGIVGKIYSFAIDKTGTANDRNFVPVCSADGVGGMFDTVNNVFYSSASSSQFTCDFKAITPPVVTFGSVVIPESDIEIIDLSTITIKPPAQAEGQVNVKITVNGVTALLENGYTYRAPMEIFTVSPPSGEEDGGTAVTITGNNFISPFGAPSTELPLAVTFDIGGTPAICENPAITNTSIACTTSAHAEGLVSVTVDNTTETFTMDAVADPEGDGKMPTTDNDGRSTGGFFYGVAIFISVATSDVSVDLNVSLSQPYDDDSTTVSVTTNDPNGYTLTVQSDQVDLICESNSSLAIPTTVGNGLDGGTWGYQVGTTISPNAWLGMTSSPSLIASSSVPTFTSPNPPAAADIQVNFGIRNGSSVPIDVSCTKYSQTIIYMAVANS